MCEQDSYYTQDIWNNADGACGDCLCTDNYSGDCKGPLSPHGPADCPDGQHMTGRYTSPCGECTYAGATIGHRKICNYDQPGMDVSTKINCCLNKNLPNNDPRGYCATGWCKGSQNCTSFFNQYCQGDYLQTNECQQFCRSNPGACDQALISYCANSNNFTRPVCGCALPSNQYILSQLKGTNGLQVPISCDYRCGVNTSAIRLQGQQDCEIGAICVADLTNVQINQVQQAIGGQDISITQNCGSTPGPIGPPTPSSNTIIQRIETFIGTTEGKLIFLLLIILILALIGVILWFIFGRKGKETTEVETKTE